MGYPGMGLCTAVGPHWNIKCYWLGTRRITLAPDEITLTSIVALAVSLVGVSGTVDFSQYLWIAPKSICAVLVLDLTRMFSVLASISCSSST